MRLAGNESEPKRRLRYAVGVVLVSFALVVGRLWQVQLIRGDQYREQTAHNFIQQRRLPTTRGVIVDRKGRVLVTNRPSFDVYATPHVVTEATTRRLLDLLVLEPEVRAEVRERLALPRGRDHYQRMLLLRDIDRDQLARLLTHEQRLSGFSVEAAPHRHFLQGRRAAHVLGYLREIASRELELDKRGRYRRGDLIGRYGVERLFDGHLRGVAGFERLVVDVRGSPQRDSPLNRLIEPPRRIEPRPGHRLVLTIDEPLQRITEAALTRHRSAAAVVVEVETGRILASASQPAFDPNLMSGRLTGAQARRLLEHEDKPLLDKVFRENYFPGSTFKAVTALAALAEGVVSPKDSLVCRGAHRLGRNAFRCHHEHGRVDLRLALVRSCNVFFFTMAERLGLDRIAHYARLLGFGATTGLGLNAEVPGIIPTSRWYERRGQPYRLGLALNASIGQGDVKVTAVQLALAYAALANGGRLMRPQVADRIETADGEVAVMLQPVVRRRLRVDPEHLALIRAGLTGVVNEAGGTAFRRRSRLVRVAGKTGTAQVARMLERGEQSEYRLRDHAWFAGFAPADAPEIAFAVIVEHGGMAGRVAAPIAMRIAEAHLVDRAENAHPSPLAARASGQVMSTEGPDSLGGAPR
jgi:penicillin-binding protein 2